MVAHAPALPNAAYELSSVEVMRLIAYRLPVGNWSSCHTGGSPQVPVLQVGQLMSEGPEEPDSGLKNEKNNLRGCLALHLGQFSFETPSPID